MNIIEALQALKDGKKIRKTWWRQDAFVSMVGDGCMCDEHHMIWAITLTNILNDEWELYTEPVRITHDERKALEWLRDGGLKKIYRSDNGIIISYCSGGTTLAVYAPIAQCLVDAEWLCGETLCIDDLLKGGASPC